MENTEHPDGGGTYLIPHQLLACLGLPITHSIWEFR